MSLSPFPTRLDVKHVAGPELSTRFDLDIAIQELVDRAYEAGVCIDSRREVEIDFTDAAVRTQWSEYEVVLVDPLVYDSLLSVRSNEKPRSARSWKVVGLEAVHQAPSWQSENFVDHGLQSVAPDVWRVYQVPCILEDNFDDTFRALFKMRPPTIDQDSDRVPVKNASTAKLGLFAIHYENESDDQRAQNAWQQFYAEMGRSQERQSGLKKRYVSYDSPQRRKPRNFM